MRMNTSKGYPTKITILILFGLSVLSLAFAGKGFSDETEPILIPLENVVDIIKDKSLPGQGYITGELAFSPDGKILALGVGKNIILWNVESEKTNTLTASITSPSKPEFCFSPDGKTIVSVMGREKIILWDVSTGNGKVIDSNNIPIFDVTFSPDGNTIASVGRFNGIHLWDVKSGKRIRTLKHNFNNLLAVRFSPDGNILAAIIDGDNNIAFWDIRTGKMINVLRGHTDGIEAITFSPDGRILASGSFDKSIILWDVATGNKIWDIQGLPNWVYDLAFSPDGKTLAVALGPDVMLFDLETNKGPIINVRKPYATGSGPQYEFRKAMESHPIALSPDGKFLATEGSNSQEIALLWDVSFLGIKRKFKKDEFETTKEYEARVSQVEVPYSRPIALQKEQYNADKGGFEIEFKGNKLFISVEKERAKELVGRKTGEIKLVGKLKYYNPENLVLIEGNIVDFVTQNRYEVYKIKEISLSTQQRI
jgi:WD40 repeat protein